jgi:uncharacterized protein (UPF0548 family)
MATLRRPSDSEIAAFAAAQANTAYSYAEVGATRAELPGGYRIDRAVYALGQGARAFERAAAAMRSWRQYDDDAGRIRICEARPQLIPGTTVILLARHLGLWTLSACRVVYVFDEPRRFGFAYGTLSHVVRGEERFEIRHADDDAVTLHLTAFSVPAMLLARLARPLARYYQKQAGQSYARGLAHALE